MISRGMKDEPPGHWLIDNDTLVELSPTIILVQITCNICDAVNDKFMHSLSKNGLIAQLMIRMFVFH